MPQDALKWYQYVIYPLTELHQQSVHSNYLLTFIFTLVATAVSSLWLKQWIITQEMVK